MFQPFPGKRTPVDDYDWSMRKVKGSCRHGGLGTFDALQTLVHRSKPMAGGGLKKMKWANTKAFFFFCYRRYYVSHLVYEREHTTLLESLEACEWSRLYPYVILSFSYLVAIIERSRPSRFKVDISNSGFVPCYTAR